MQHPIDRHLLDHLSRGWRVLHLSVEAPERVPGWDAIVLTAASDRQAMIYERQLASAREHGRIPQATRTFVVPDPQGQRIGSGGATLNALRFLARETRGRPVETMKTLLVHAGGDSKRVPWANLFGKPFLPFPILADIDRPIPTLFDHLLAITAPVPHQAEDGVLLSLTGDVLPLFDAARIELNSDDAAVVTTPVSLDIAGRHGVIVSGADDNVSALLQKPSPESIVEANGLVEGGAALVDTGIYAFAGRALAGLTHAACAEPDPVSQLLTGNIECSLYEEIARAFVPAQRETVRLLPFGDALVDAVGQSCLRSARVDEFAFVHLGTTAELLQHLCRNWHGELPRSVLAETGPGVARTAFCYTSRMGRDTRVGSGSLILSSQLGDAVEIGNRCVVVDIDARDEPFGLPGNCCLWRVPLRSTDNGRFVLVCCGVDDNPKDGIDQATFCNRSLRDWLHAHDVREDDLWCDGDVRTVWTARLFPVQGEQSGLHMVRWMLDKQPCDTQSRGVWQSSERLSLAGIHEQADIGRLLRRKDELHGSLLLEALRFSVDGVLDRNVGALGLQLSTPDLRQRAISLASQTGRPNVPVSRCLQIEADLLNTAGRRDEAAERGCSVFAAVKTEVDEAIRPVRALPVSGIPAGYTASMELPVRLDLAGGWSDTPPYCLERPAGVLNLAMALDGSKPVHVQVEALAEAQWALVLGNGGPTVVIPNTPDVGRTGDLTDPFALLRAALVLAGYGSTDGISQGVRVVACAGVPRGSGLGTSSILGAALVSALQRLAGRPHDFATVSDMVLNLEQMMTTGGGWQDQVGGLVPGIKFISSVPVTPMRLSIERVPLLPAVQEELETRLVVAFSGQERLAKNVLQIVVRRYLQRDSRLLDAIEGLMSLAVEGRRVLATGDLDGLGGVLREVWHLHQQLDPHCSNPAVDAMFREVDDLASGYKLAGAGGGGFMGILAKDAGSATRIRSMLGALGNGVRVYNWTLA